MLFGISFWRLEKCSSGEYLAFRMARSLILLSRLFHVVPDVWIPAKILFRFSTLPETKKLRMQRRVISFVFFLFPLKSPRKIKILVLRVPNNTTFFFCSIVPNGSSSKNSLKSIEKLFVSWIRLLWLLKKNGYNKRKDSIYPCDTLKTVSKMFNFNRNFDVKKLLQYTYTVVHQKWNTYYPFSVNDTIVIHFGI